MGDLKLREIAQAGSFEEERTGTSKYRCFKCSNKIPKDDLEAIFIKQMSDSCSMTIA